MASPATQCWLMVLLDLPPVPPPSQLWRGLCCTRCAMPPLSPLVRLCSRSLPESLPFVTPSMDLRSVLTPCIIACSCVRLSLLLCLQLLPFGIIFPCSVLFGVLDSWPYCLTCLAACSVVLLPMCHESCGVAATPLFVWHQLIGGCLSHWM